MRVYSFPMLLVIFMPCVQTIEPVSRISAWPIRRAWRRLYRNWALCVLRTAMSRQSIVGAGSLGRYASVITTQIVTVADDGMDLSVRLF
eukprot:SAG11_NODE_3947_length_2137_cov_1.269382_2_plen_89_part_00